MPAVSALFLGALLAGCGGSKLSPETTQAIAAALPAETAATPTREATQPNASPSLWTEPAVRSRPVAALASGDGQRSTASSALQLTAPALGLSLGLRTPSENWKALQERLRRDRDVGNWMASRRRETDAWMAQNFERPERVGGWSQAYIEVSSGRPLTWTPTSPEPPAGSTQAEQEVHGAWVSLGRSYNARQMQQAARLYRVTGEAQYAAWAAGQLDFYASHYQQWPLRTAEGRSRMHRQGLDEAVDAFELLDAARLLESYAGAARVRNWRSGFFTPMAENLKSTSAPLSNIGLWHNMAIAAIGMRFRDEALIDWATDSEHGIRATMAYGLTADNFWIEGTFAYNNYVLEGLSKFLVSAGVEGFMDRFAQEREQAARLLMAVFDYRFDDGSLPNPNDSVSAQALISELTHWRMHRIVPTYWGLKKSNEWATWDSMLDPPAALPVSAPNIPQAQTRHFPTLRQAVLRAGPWQAYVHYGQSNGNHVQEELLTYELHEGTTPIAVDPGTVNYSSPLHKGYFATGVANNVPLIDGVGQNLWAKGDLISFSATEDRLVAEQSAYQRGVNVRRGYRVTPNGFVEQSTITLVPSAATASPSPRRLGVVFSSACEMEPGSGLQGASALQALPATTGFAHLSQLRLFDGASRWQVLLRCGSQRYSYTVSGPAGQRVYLAKAPATPQPATRNTLYYELTSTRAQFEAEIRRLR